MSEMVIGKKSGLVSYWLSNRFRAVVRASLTLSIGSSATKSNRTACKVRRSQPVVATPSDLDHFLEVVFYETRKAVWAFLPHHATYFEH
jgi:hypothetical protein